MLSEKPLFLFFVRGVSHEALNPLLHNYTITNLDVSGHPPDTIIIGWVMVMVSDLLIKKYEGITTRPLCLILAPKRDLKIEYPYNSMCSFLLLRAEINDADSSLNSIFYMYDYRCYCC